MFTVGKDKCPSVCGLNIWGGWAPPPRAISLNGVKVKRNPAWSLAWALVHAEAVAGRS